MSLEEKVRQAALSKAESLQSASSKVASLHRKVALLALHHSLFSGVDSPLNTVWLDLVVEDQDTLDELFKQLFIHSAAVYSEQSEHAKKQQDVFTSLLEGLHQRKHWSLEFTSSRFLLYCLNTTRIQRWDAEEKHVRRDPLCDLLSLMQARGWRFNKRHPFLPDNPKQSRVTRSQYTLMLEPFQHVVRTVEAGVQAQVAWRGGFHTTTEAWIKSMQEIASLWALKHGKEIGSKETLQDTAQRLGLCWAHILHTEGVPLETCMEAWRTVQVETLEKSALTKEGGATLPAFLESFTCGVERFCLTATLPFLPSEQSAPRLRV